MGTSNSKLAGQASTPKEYLQLIKACTKRAQKRISTPNHSTSPKFNFEQCKYLVDKLGLAIEAAKLFLAQSNAQHLDHLSTEDSVKCLEGFKLLYALSREVESFTLNCGKDTWIQIALTLANMSEFILSMGFNLELWRIAFGAGQNSTPIKEESIYHDEVQSVAEKASNDLASLKRSLKGVIGSNKYKRSDQKLAAFILHRVDKKLIPIFHEDSMDSSRSNLSEAVLSMKQKDLKLLGRGSSASVFSWTWLGVELVVKEFHGKDNPDFMKEVSIMKGLFHPNIISVLCFAKNNRKSFIVMERMDGDLESLMKARWDICGANKPLFCIYEAVDIMLQIGTGMLYLHKSRIVHRDLKSMNILVRIAKATNDGEVEYVVAKVADFGVSKTKLKSITDSHPTPNMGTTRWMAPELLKFTEAELQKISMPVEVEDENVKYPFKCDIYSFAMVCYEVLSGEYPFYNTSSHMKVKEMVLTGIRPGLPDGCPIKLKDLIERCWSMDPEERPSFDDICKELRRIKCSLLTLSTSLANTSSGISSMTTTNDSNIDHHQDECGRPMNSAVSVAMAADGSVSDYSDVDYCQQSISSIDAVQKLVAEDPNMLRLNDQQCRYLAKKLTETGRFLRAKSSLVKIRDSTDIRRMPLLHLHFAVKRAEKLVRGCCCEQESWLEAAVTLSHVKETIKDILLDLRWWTSMVDIAITSVKGKSSGQTTRLLKILESAEEDFEKLLKELHTSNNGLVRAASEDESELLGKVREVETSFAGGGRSAVQKHEYLLAVHVRSRLENSEAETAEDLNEYEDAKLIGFGGFGAVQDVRWMRRRCALKILNRTCKEEATKLRNFQHPHIVKFFRYFEAPFRHTPNGRPRDTPQGTPGSDSGPVYRGASQSHILMELLPMDLSQYLGKLQDTASFTVGSKGKAEHTGGAPLPVDVALDVMLQTVKAMWHLNSKDVAHRDVKPSNLLVRPVSFDEVPELTARGYVWAELADLGLAKTEAFSSAFSTQPKEIGTKMYGAPEVFNADIISEKSYPRKADVWSFGIMFCEVLTGKPPFPGVADGTLRFTELQEKIVKGLRPKLPENCPDYLKFIIESCWQLRPEDRPTFEDLWRLMRLAQARSLGLIQTDLFYYKTRTGLASLRPLKRITAPAPPSSAVTADDSLLASSSFASFRRGLQLSHPASLQFHDLDHGKTAKIPGIEGDRGGDRGEAQTILQSHDLDHDMTAEIPQEDRNVLQCGRPTNSAVSAAMAAGGSVSDYSNVDYCQQSISSITAVQKLVEEWKVQLNIRQCEYLADKLTETGRFLRAKSRDSLVKIRGSADIRGKALLHLHFAVKLAEKLVRGCCCEQESWLETAVTLSHVKEAIKDILLDLRWWTSTVDIAITSVKGKSSGQTTRLLKILESAEEDFEKLLRELHTPNDLVRAAIEDESELLGKVREVETSFAGGGRSAVQKHEYLLAVHVRSRLENSEAETAEDLNEYEDGKLIGFGGFGVVQDVRWMRRRCALKILNRTCKEEATKLRNFQHPHIVKFFRYFEAPFRHTPNGRPRDTPQGTPGSDSGQVYRGASQSHILMELLPMDLSQYLGKLQDTASFTVGSKGKAEHTGGAPLPVDVALDVMLQTVKAMWHLNSKDVAHRDLKPSNLLVRLVSVDEVSELNSRGYLWVELADLGLAKTEAFSSAFSTQPKKIGSKMYGAPEVFNADIISEKSYPRKADVWSFGIIFCEVLTGKPPFPGVADGTMRLTVLQEKIVKGLRPKLPENCPDYLKFIIESCWQLRPEDRPTFEDLWRLMRLAQARSLGLIQTDLFYYKTRTGLASLRPLKRITAPAPPSRTSFVHAMRRVLNLNANFWGKR